MNQEEARSFRYRYDLDGLRGIAIALVVIYHVFVGRVSGGVDVFLLLSGYFFLGSQLRYASKPSASLNPWWPIWRTLRRLVPALVLVIGVTYLLVRACTPELMRTELAQQITATMFYVQNWELSRQNADYAAASAATSPLQHMWSMSVQGQFYLMGIAFALGIAAVLRLRAQVMARRSTLKAPRVLSVHDIAGPILVVATVASFAYASREGFFGSPANYYSTWSRAWELTLGAVLAVYGAKWHVPQRLSNLFTGLGLACLVVTGALIADSTAYPGPLSLLPLGGAVLIIIGGGGSLSRAMASRKARWLGDIAYPLYLWHWPLLILTTVALHRQTPPWWLGVIIIAVSLLLADLTHRFVERPLRQHRKRPLAHDLPVHRALTDLQERPGRLRAAGGALVGLCVVGLLAIQPTWERSVSAAGSEALDSRLYPGAAAFALGAEVPEGVEYRPEPILVGNMAPATTVRHCFVAQNMPVDYIPATGLGDSPCLFGDLRARTEVYLVGGSHAEQWLSPLDRLGRQMHFKVVPMVRQGCPIELGEDLTVYPECAQWSKEVVKRIVAAKPALVVSNTTRPSGPLGTGPDFVPAGYAAFWEALAEEDIPFLGLRDNPWGFDETGKGRAFDKCFVATQDAVGCGMTFDQVYAPVDPAADVLAKYTNMIALDTAPWFCDADGVCPVVIGNVMVYRDMHHISNAFADSAMPMLRAAIAPFLEGEVQRQAPATTPTASRVPARSTPVSPAATVTTGASTSAPAPSGPVPYPGYLSGGAV